MGTLWLATLVVATHDWRRWRLTVLAATCVSWAMTFEGIAPHAPSTPLLLLTLVLQVAAIAFNVWVLLSAASTHPQLQASSSPGQARSAA